MNFLEASKAVKDFRGGPRLSFLLGMSGTADLLNLYLRAVGATRGVDVSPRNLPFGTLQQSLRQPVLAGQKEVYLLMPWDLAPELDWRSGVPALPPKEDALRKRVKQTIDLLAARGAKLLYMVAPSVPIWLRPFRNEGLELWIQAQLRTRGADILPSQYFSLSTYLSTGNPCASAQLASIATRVLDAVQSSATSTAKVLVTDLDHTLWSGIVGDDGLEGLSFRSEGRGFPHFLYQNLLLRLKSEGVLLAAVSKNDPTIALLPFVTGHMTLQQDDFVAIIASWNAKSAQIASLAKRLNVGLDDFVFIDDNPVELAEVATELPMVRSLLFPKSVSEIPALLGRMVELFKRDTTSAEDLERTELYRRRLAGLPPSEAVGGDITTFLRDLSMSLTITNRTFGDQTRALQLINKTNQFNLNGRRLLAEDLNRLVETGSKVYTCTLADRTGSHGEILVAVVTPDWVVTSFVMSCRVFQRRVEYAFLAWLSSQNPQRLAVEYAGTERNKPTLNFLQDVLGHVPSEGLNELPVAHLETRYRSDLTLFEWSFI